MNTNIDKKFKIAIACGGTGGHIFPGLATAQALMKRGHEITLWLAGRSIENLVTANWPGPVIKVQAEGFPSQISIRALRSAWKTMAAVNTCRKQMKDTHPDAVLGMGSYASAGPIGAAILLGLPTVLHEANVIPGRAIAFFSRWATAVAGSFEETRYYLRRKEIVITGMPLRQDLVSEASDHFLPPKFDPSIFTILTIGGSRGAQKLNELVPQCLAALALKGQKLQVIHLAGRDDEEAVRQVYTAAGITNFVQAFYHNMGDLYRAANLAICRAGAATCSELAAFSLPALLVPYPHATRNHQYMNARALEKKGVADTIAEKGLSSEWLTEYITSCIESPDRLLRMKAAAKKIITGNAAEKLADLVELVAAKKYKTPA